MRSTSNLVPLRPDAVIQRHMKDIKGSSKKASALTEVEKVLNVMEDAEWEHFKRHLDTHSPDFREMAIELNNVLQTKSLTTKGGNPISVSQLRHWCTQLTKGRSAMLLEESLEAYKGIDSKLALEKVVVESINETNLIVEKVFSLNADIKDSEYLKILPAMRKATIAGAKALQEIESAEAIHAAKITGAILLGKRLDQMFQGTAMEQAVRDTITQCVIDIESYMV